MRSRDTNVVSDRLPLLVAIAAVLLSCEQHSDPYTEPWLTAMCEVYHVECAGTGPLAGQLATFFGRDLQDCLNQFTSLRGVATDNAADAGLPCQVDPDACLSAVTLMVADGDCNLLRAGQLPPDCRCVP